eukprot:GFUD01042125.1.p1 GENE.GFUD01042125.1~~GFUD01042125.1.p1  ORF type:complete len:197 (+),score=46.16 GFUD01042125.1:227-817(+)
MCKTTDVNLILNNIAVDTTKELTVDGDDLDQDLDHAFKLLEQERFVKLMNVLKRTILAKVLPLCPKVLNLDNGSLLEMPSETLKNILGDMVHLGEQEPYGILGGTLMVNFGKTEYVTDNSDSVNSSSSFTKVGRFPLNPDITSTFELHLTFYPSTQVKHKVTNLLRRLQGKPPLLVVDQKFNLTKKKLYRSPNHKK